MADLSLDDQVSLLMQGTEYGDDTLKQAMADELRQRLQDVEAEGRPLRVYCGFDPRTSDLHLGHTVPMRKMRQFQELGHDVTFVIGRFTSLVGDPSDKDSVRAQLNMEEAARNAETYAEQAFKLLDPKRTHIAYNDMWLSDLNFQDLIGLASNFTVQQFLAREAFRKRWDAEDPIYFHEFFYALMQGYDAYHLKTDVQIGGSDQLFNIVTAARKLMEALGERPNIAIIHGILPGTDGVVKMSKSLGNHIPLNAAPEDMYGKVMSVPDIAMSHFFRLVTRWTPNEIDEIESGLASGGLHPRDVKMRLAREIVEIFHGEEAVEPAEEAFIRVFQEREEPEEMPDFVLTPGKTLVEVMVDSGLVESKSEARRLIEQRGVRLDGIIQDDQDKILDSPESQVLRVGKRRFIRLSPREWP
ncbi:MAG TPA: tyrosine--tRNA ligase [Anaerolineae bacterium]|nr:tyrosine--tRNA ligase [Anaerolineae bacterium]